MSRPPYVAVCGAGRASAEEAARAQAVGRGLAEGGAVLVCGGLGGVMAAAAEGAATAGGTVVGILPGTSHDDADPHCTIALPTGLGEARNVLVVGAADAVIAVGGLYGTLSEIAHARKLGRTVVRLGSWELERAGLDDDALLEADDPEGAVRLALEAAAKRLGRG